MKKYFKRTGILVLALTLMSGFYCNSDTSEGSSGEPSDANGTWSGTWQSSYGFSDTFTAIIIQDYEELSGTIDVPYLALNDGVLKGAVSGTSIRFGDVNDEITFNGTINENSASGTYVYPSMGDHGTWTAFKNDAGTSAGITFSDEFDRADSAVVGNGWNEAEGNGDSGKENDIIINSNRLVFTGGYQSTYCAIPSVSRAIDTDLPVMVDLVFSVDNSSSYYMELMIYNPVDALLNNYSVIFQSGGDISIGKNGSISSLTNSYPLIAGYTYFAFITINNGELRVQINDEYGSAGIFQYIDTDPLTEFTFLMISGGWHDGTNAYHTYVDSVSLDFL